MRVARIAAETAAALAALGALPSAQAFKVDLGSPDTSLAIDTTVRYNAAMRTKERDDRLVTSPAVDEGNYLFDKNDLVLSRLDLYSELDLAWRDRYGLRASAAAWYDHNFPDKSRSAPAFASRPNYPNNEYTDYIKRYYQGPSGEFMDVFAWGNFDLGPTRLNVKAGRFAWLPGEFLLGNGGSVSFSMAPSDGRKSDLSPGASAKETALPIGQVGLTWQLNPEWTLMGQYTGEFRSSRISEGGTFFQVADVALEGPPFISNPAEPGPTDPPIRRGPSLEGRRGDVAIGLRWQPQWADGDAFGLWYRKFDDKNPTWSTQLQFTPEGAFGRAVYARDIELLGLTYNTVLGSWGFGAELNYRRHMPLAMFSGVRFSTFPSDVLVNDPNLEGPRGNTVHALLSGAVTINKNPIFDAGSLALQLDYAHLEKITDHPERFNGAASGVAGRCADNAVLRGCATRDALSIGGNFTPTWQQLFPSMDVSMPVTLLYGIKGNAAAVGAGTLPEESYLLRIGGRLEWLVAQYKHQFDLAYTTRGGKTGQLPSAVPGGTPTNAFSGLANLRDRNYLSFTYQTAF